MRLEITRRAELAVRAMVFLGSVGGRVKSREIALELATTSMFVPQVVGPLVKAGWVQSHAGPTGGYNACVDLRDLSVLDVVDRRCDGFRQVRGRRSTMRLRCAVCVARRMGARQARAGTGTRGDPTVGAGHGEMTDDKQMSTRQEMS
ncbi:MAG: putative Rrf2 family DNA-binding protein [Acidimicrobiaceae bacterium]|nr:MAG: putative Rrf2 family DNA-binding protein [Acidimicrobiaceae bacterium]